MKRCRVDFLVHVSDVLGWLQVGHFQLILTGGFTFGRLTKRFMGAIVMMGIDLCSILAKALGLMYPWLDTLMYGLSRCSIGNQMSSFVPARPRG